MRSFFSHSLWLSSLLLLGCPSGEPVGDDDDDTEAPRQDPPAYSNGTCPELEDGFNDGFPSGDDERAFLIELPDEPEGAPVVFAWHWLQGSAGGIMDQLDFASLAGEGAIVVAPVASGNSSFEWEFLSSATGNPDLQFFEDMLSCIDAQWTVDLDRVYSTGMSAGGLFTSYLTVHESQWLAATAPLSGGVTEDQYVVPARKLPVLLTWGGPTDFAVGFDFHTANETFSELLRDDGHFVAECMHDDGHFPPPDSPALTWRWFEAHPKGVDPEPYADGLPDAYPDFCSLPE